MPLSSDGLDVCTPLHSECPTGHHPPPDRLVRANFEAGAAFSLQQMDLSDEHCEIRAKTLQFTIGKNRTRHTPASAHSWLLGSCYLAQSLLHGRNEGRLTRSDLDSDWVPCIFLAPVTFLTSDGVPSPARERPHAAFIFHRMSACAHLFPAPSPT